MSSTYRFVVITTPEKVEEVTALGYSAGMSGLEEIPLDENVRLLCYFDTPQEALDATRLITSHEFDASLIEPVENEDWNAQWRASIKPVQISDTIWVSPEWLTPPLKDDDYWIKIEPRMAFGTGHHETTRVCAQMVLDKKETASSLLDIGTGSGILCFVAEYAGYTKLKGIEIDPDCEINLGENREANKKEVEITFEIGSVDILDPSEKYDTIVMNIIRTHSEPLLPACEKHLAEGGSLIWSGLLLTERDRCIESAEKQNWKLVEENQENEWWAGRFIRSKK